MRVLLSFAAALLIGAASPVLAQGTLRIGMTASDIPLTTGQTDNGGEGMRFLGYTMYDALVNWDLSSADKASDLAPGLADRAGPQPVELGPDRRHDIAARGGIAEPHRRMTGAHRGRVPLTFDLQLLGKSLIGVLPTVRRDRRTLPFT